jgi:hypothetical protein
MMWMTVEGASAMAWGMAHNTQTDRQTAKKTAVTNRLKGGNGRMPPLSLDFPVSPGFSWNPRVAGFVN